MPDCTLRNFPKALLLVVVALAAIAALIAFDGDLALARALRDVAPELRRVARWITQAGDATAYLVLSALAAIFYGFVRRDRAATRTALLALAAFASSGILVNILKFLFGRTRPGVFYDHGVEAFLGPTWDSAIRSFPSGHATTVAVAAALVVLLAPRWGGLAVAGAALVGVSRLLVGYHFLSDVLAGFLLGWFSVWATHRLFVRQGWWPETHAAQAPGRRDG
jgi:membrane-associated phospholipid phosphatase